MGNVVSFSPSVTANKWTTSGTGLVLADSIDFDEWCALGAELARIERGVQWWIGDWWAFGKHRYGARAKAAAQGIFGRAIPTMRRCGTVARAFESDRRRSLLEWSHHAEVACLDDHDEADALLDLAEAENWPVRQLRSEVARRRNGNSARTHGDTCMVEDLHILIAHGRRFGTIYADPPWIYNNQSTRAATSNHYRGMTVDELCALPVRELALSDAHLHLWTTNGFLFECSRIFSAWGFEFKSSFVWVKTEIGIGNYWRNAHEFLLTASRGNAKSFHDKTLRSWLECSRGSHSSKPEHVRDFIERASPHPYIELFARHPSSGWTVWGDQIESGLLYHNLERMS